MDELKLVKSWFHDIDWEGYELVHPQAGNMWSIPLTRNDGQVLCRQDCLGCNFHNPGKRFLLQKKPELFLEMSCTGIMTDDDPKKPDLSISMGAWDTMTNNPAENCTLPTSACGYNLKKPYKHLINLWRNNQLDTLKSD